MCVCKRYIKIVLAIVSAIAMFSCTSEWQDELEPGYSNSNGNPGDRVILEETRDVLVLYSAGNNDISSFLSNDIDTLRMSGWLPTAYRDDDVVVVYAHSPKKNPVLCRLYRDFDDTVVMDTLVTYGVSDFSSTTTQLNKVLTEVKSLFPAAGYGLVFSSHATGYLPAGFYGNENSYIYTGDMMRSVGQDKVSGVSHEIELADFVDAIPMKLDYLIFDACLMGGVEVAYQLRNKVKYLVCSPTEVLAEGMNYKTLVSNLFASEEPDLQKVCYDYFVQYDVREGVNRSATITLLDCTRMSQLAGLCEELFESYRDEILKVNYRYVQRYYRESQNYRDRYHWFYDLESILVEAGITDAEKVRLRAALDECIIYKNHTPSFMNSFAIKTYSGLSMYLPSHGHSELSKFYKTLDWNVATGLVR